VTWLASIPYFPEKQIRAAPPEPYYFNKKIKAVGAGTPGQRQQQKLICANGYSILKNALKSS